MPFFQVVCEQYPNRLAGRIVVSIEFLQARSIWKVLSVIERPKRDLSGYELIETAEFPAVLWKIGKSGKFPTTYSAPTKIQE